MKISTQRIRREFRLLGWEAEPVRSGHMVCVHKETGLKVYCAASPSDQNWKKQVMRDMQKALKKAGRSPHGNASLRGLTKE